ncbi:unnamed protein product [Agarophyton chilense]|eukprot:gb/GEZJ01002852.1/.p2 GENE.gb/GEZJ01002852.1/~~gb/GEZJ01002852.1/.p2  ORF type:complete len:401 (+),score=75.77 gb/GEZJ01002852.1/:113-1315(+)
MTEQPSAHPSSPVTTAVGVSASAQSAHDSIAPELPLHSLHILRALLESLSILTIKTVPFPSLHDDLQRASLRVTHLSAETLNTLRLFCSSAVKERYDIRVVHDLLKDGLYPAAKSLLLASNSQHRRLAQVSNSLAMEYEQTANAVTECLTRATHARAEQSSRQNERQAVVTSTFNQLTNTRRKAQGALRAFEEAEKLHDQAEQREAVARKRVVALQAAHVAAVVGGFVSARSTPFVIGAGSAAALASTFEGEVMRAREERAVHLRQRNDARDRRSDLEVSVATLVTELRERKREEVLESTVLDSLIDCATTLRRLAGVMLKAEAFWKGLSTGLQDRLLELVVAAEGREFDDGMGERLLQVETFWEAVGSVCENASKGVDSGLNRDVVIEGRQIDRIEWDV